MLPAKLLPLCHTYQAGPPRRIWARQGPIFYPKIFWLVVSYKRILKPKITLLALPASAALTRLLYHFRLVWNCRHNISLSNLRSWGARNFISILTLAHHSWNLRHISAQTLGNYARICSDVLKCSTVGSKPYELAFNIASGSEANITTSWKLSVAYLGPLPTLSSHIER